MPPEHQARGKQRSFLVYTWLGTAVFFLHLLVTGGHLMSPDEELLYRTAESIALRGTTRVLPLEADIATGRLHPSVPPEATFATRLGKEPGTYYAQYLPLQPLLAMPIIWAGKALEGALAQPFASVIWPSMAIEYIRPLSQEEFARAAFRRGLVVMIFNPLVAALSAIALARLGRLLTGSRAAGVGAAVLFAFGTIMWPQSRTFFTEPLAALFGFLALDQIIRWSMKPLGDGLKNAITAGVMLGLANWVRVDSPFFTAGLIPGMAVIGTWRYLRAESYSRLERKLPWVDVLAAGGISLGAWLLLQAFNTTRYGFDPTSGYGDQAEAVRFSTPLLIGLHGLLFSPGKGVFYFSPALIAGVWGWVRAPRGFTWLRKLVIFGYLPFFLAMAAWQNWDGGWCWGPRHIIQLTLPVMLGAVFLFTGTMSAARRIALAVILIVGAAVQIFGSSQNPLDYYSEYFQTFSDGEYHRVNLTPIQAQNIASEFNLRVVERDGGLGQTVNPGAFPAPMIDSLYLPQHTQWASYGRMWRLGYCDWYLLNAVKNNRAPDLWSKEP